MERPQQWKATWSAQFTKLSELPVKKAPEEHWKVLWKLKPREVVTGRGLVPEPRGKSQRGLCPAPLTPSPPVQPEVRQPSFLSPAVYLLYLLFSLFPLSFLKDLKTRDTGPGIELALNKYWFGVDRWVSGCIPHRSGLGGYRNEWVVVSASRGSKSRIWLEAR